MDTHSGLGDEHPQRLPSGNWQLRRVGAPATVPNSSSLIRLKDHGEVTVGRSPAADYFVDSAITLRLISRIHVSIIGQVQPNGTPKFTIINRGLNGTYINDIKMGFPSENKQVLHEGDRVTFGHPGCASIQPGSCAPQPDSEFQFIFEFVPAPTSTLLKDNNSQERIAAPCNENFQHNLLNHRTIHLEKAVDDAEVLLSHSEAKSTNLNGHAGARLADSPQSNASTSEKENEICCGGTRDVKMPSVDATVDDHRAILPSKTIGSLQCLGKSLNYDRLLKDDSSPSSKCIQRDKNLSSKFSTISCVPNIPSDHLPAYSSQETTLQTQNKTNSSSSNEYILQKHPGYISVPKMDFTDTFSSSFCSNGGSIQVNSTTIVLGDECEDEDEVEVSSVCSSSSSNDLPALLTPPPGSSSTALGPKGINSKVKSLPYDSLGLKRKKVLAKSLSFQSASSRHTHSTGSRSGSDGEDTLSESSGDEDHSEHIDALTSKPGQSQHADTSFVDSLATKSILCQKDHRIISHDLLGLVSASSLQNTEKEVLEIGSESDSSSSSYKASTPPQSVSSSDSISPPDLSPQVPAAHGVYQGKSSTHSISPDSSKACSSSESDLSKTASRSHSTVSRTAVHRKGRKRSSLSGSSSRSSKSNLVKPQKNSYLKDLVPLMYSSSDEDEVHVENRTKEIVKKIYSPHKKKRSKVESKPKKNLGISRNEKLLSLEADMDGENRGTPSPLSPSLMRTSPSLSPSSSSNSSSWSRSSKKIDLATKEVNGGHIQDTPSNRTEVHPKHDMALTSGAERLTDANPLHQPPSPASLPNNNAGLSIKTDNLSSQTKQCKKSSASSTSSTSSFSTSVLKKSTGLSIRTEKDDFCAKLKKSISSASSTSSTTSSSSSSPSLLCMSNESELLKSNQLLPPHPRPPHGSTSSEQSQPSSVADKSRISLEPVSVKALDSNLTVQTLQGLGPSHGAKLPKAADNAAKQQTYKTEVPLYVKEQRTNVTENKSKLPDQQSIPSQDNRNVSIELKGPSGKPSGQQNPTVANDSSDKSSSTNTPSKKLSKNAKPHPTLKAQASAAKVGSENKSSKKPKESTAQEKPSTGIKPGQGKSTLPPSSAEKVPTNSSKVKKTPSKPQICTLDDSAFMKDLENSVTIKEKLTRTKAATKTAATTKTAAKKSAVETKVSLIKDSAKVDNSNAKRKNKMSTNEFLNRKRKLSSDEDDSSDVPRLTRSLTTASGAQSKQSSILIREAKTRTNRAPLARNSSLSSSSSATKTKRKKTSAKKNSKSKRRKEIISDTTSEEDLANDSVEDEEEDWDLPDGVQYYDNLCSAAKCLNPVGNKVDWVMCDHCEQWYHVICVDCPMEVIQKENVQFHCGICQKKS